MKAKCSNCKHFERLQVAGYPFEHIRRCARHDGMKIQLDSGHNLMDKSNMPCFEARQIALWRLPAAVGAAIFWSVFISFVLYFTLAITLASSADFRPVPMAVPVIIFTLATAAGISMAVMWYRGDL